MLRFNYLYLLALLIPFTGCNTPPVSSPNISPKTHSISKAGNVSILTFSEDKFYATITIPHGSKSLGPIFKTLMADDNTNVLDQYLDGTVNEDTAPEIKDAIIASLPDGALDYRFIEFTTTPSSNILQLALDRNLIEEIALPIIKKYTYPGAVPILPLFSISTTPPIPNDLKNLKLLLPCENVPVPERPLLLPNAPRAYRHGTHRGIDFYVNWGTPVRAVADGVIIRAEHGYKEMSADFRLDVLSDAKILGRTPSDVFEHLLLGQAVYIDHGFDLVPGYRAVTIYAHMSHINPNITIGSMVRSGEVIGQSGNTGTKDSTLKKKTGAHLHWEMILQNKVGEYYLGQGLKSDSLYVLFQNIF